jgi:hypothetical protein
MQTGTDEVQETMVVFIVIQLASGTEAHSSLRKVGHVRRTACMQTGMDEVQET